MGKATAKDFDQFWAAYPRKAGKIAAEKAFQKARTQATQAEILAGVAAYIKHKPSYADWCHPTTWLNQGRWMDEYSEERPPPEPVDWFEECKRLHEGACGGRYAHWLRKQMDEYRGQ